MSPSEPPCQPPFAILAAEAPLRRTPSVYPPEFARRMAGRSKQPLGDLFGLKAFGVNLCRLAPGASSALHHAHSGQDEFLYVLAGTPTLCLGEARQVLAPGQCVGFPAGGGLAHHLVNESEAEAVVLEVGQRGGEDYVGYPHDDLRAELTPEGRWAFFHKDGQPY